MTMIGSDVDPDGAAVQAVLQAMAEPMARLGALSRTVLEEGGEASVARHRSRGKLTARERVDRLLDPDAPFLELSAFSGNHRPTEAPGSRLVTGIGPVAGVECMVIANVPTIKAGANTEFTIRKQVRALEIAAANRLPVVHLVESAGGDLDQQAEIFVPGGRIFSELSRLSASGVPSVAVVFGTATAGGAYIPGMSDYTVFVRGAGAAFLGGPPLVKMAINEDTTEQALGGADLHGSVSGLADYVVDGERSAIDTAREIVGGLGWRKLGEYDRTPFDEPVHPPEELLGLAPLDDRRPVEIKEIVARVVDGSRLEEFKPGYGANLVTGWAAICGYRIGVIANNGVLFSAEANKAAHMIQLCNDRQVPILFVQNITGFMVGTAAERGGIIKDGSKLVNAVSNSSVPHLVLMPGASYGAGNYAMSGRSYDPRFVFSWPSHRIAVMGGPQLAGVMSIIRRSAAVKAGRDYSEDDDLAMRTKLEEMIRVESDAFYATGRLWDDGVIDPRQSRTVLGLALSAIHSAPISSSRTFASFRM
jgi:acetyl-CoA carboxylase carboxyltransferase component